MEIIVEPFKKWGDLFIVKDYEGTVGHKCPNHILSGVSPTNDDFIGEVLEVIENFVSCNSDAIMVELSFLKDYKRESITKLVTNYLERNGYEDLESYENRLAFGKFKD